LVSGEPLSGVASSPNFRFLLAALVRTADLRTVAPCRAVTQSQVAGTELYPRFIETFVDVLENNDLAFHHAEDVDFETELALDKQIRKIVQATPAPPDLARFKS
jgi:hypothetical protein